MKATGIVRRIDDLGRVVIPKEIRRTMRIREGDPLLTSLTQEYRFCNAMRNIAERLHNTDSWNNKAKIFISIPEMSGDGKIG